MKIQCDVDEQVWRQARVKGLSDGKSMGEIVTVALRNWMNHMVAAGPAGVVPVERKTVSVASKPVDDGYVALEYKTCLKCKGKVVVADAERTRDGKYLCRDCADDLRVANA